MEKLKGILIIVLCAILALFLGFLSIRTLESGTEHNTNQLIKDLKKENSQLKDELEEMQEKIDELNSQFNVIDDRLIEETKNTVDTKEEDKTTTYKHQNLINELQELIDDNISMKLKSRGTRVGTLQNFLNIYKNTSNKIDNDYGLTTQKAIILFQKEQGLKADGEAGPTTFAKMIDWLKKH